MARPCFLQRIGQQLALPLVENQRVIAKDRAFGGDVDAVLREIRFSDDHLRIVDNEGAFTGSDERLEMVDVVAVHEGENAVAEM